MAKKMGSTLVQVLCGILFFLSGLRFPHWWPHGVPWLPRVSPLWHTIQACHSAFYFQVGFLENGMVSLRDGIL